VSYKGEETQEEEMAAVEKEREAEREKKEKAVEKKEGEREVVCVSYNILADELAGAKRYPLSTPDELLWYPLTRLQHTATHCNILSHTATHCNTLQHTATHCNTLQHTATHCNTL